jgi:hypothetical protein
VKLTWAVVATAMAMVMATPGAGQAQGVDTTCVLPLTKTDPATVNIAYPDEAAIYWISAYQQVPGTRLRITGRYPHSRYFSFNAYDAAQRPLDALADVEIAPDAGSANPFVAGAARTGTDRDYTAFIDFGPQPTRRAPNTLYTGTGQTPAPNTTGTFILRVYVPDKGRDETGGVGLPTVTLESTLTDGTRPAASPCAELVKPPVPGVNQVIKDASPPAPPSQLTTTGRNPPRWVKFKNLVQAVNRVVTDNPFLDSFATLTTPAEAAGGQGAFLSNVHNSYVFTGLNRAYGDVSVTEFRAPAIPDTRPGTTVMPAAQLRYFSMCTNDTATQRFVACATDDQTAIGADDRAAYVVSVPAARPAWATADCGYTWLPFGAASTGTLILRHMLPDAGFPQAIQRAKPGDEAATMGDHLPVTRYLPAGASRPCRALRLSSGPALGLPPSTPPRSCTSRRSFTIRLSRALRSATVTVAGRKVAVRSGRRLRAPIDLRGLPKGSFRVRIEGRTKTGRRVVQVRTYRTCAARRAR